MIIDYLKNSKKPEDIEVYNQAIANIINTYYQIADEALNDNDLDLVLASYNSILNYKNNTKLQICFAKLYLKQDSEKAMQHIKDAFYLAKKQEDKRIVKEQLINMFYFFEKNGDTFNQKLCKTYLNQLGENSILVDEREAIINVSDIKVSIKHADTKYFPTISFQITNNSKNTLNKLYVKAVIISKKEHTVEELQEKIFPDMQKELKPSEKSEVIELVFNTGFRNKERINDYIINLYFSQNAKNWILFRQLDNFN